MNVRRLFFPLFFLVMAAAISLAMVAKPKPSAFIEPACPTVIQQGELRLTIPAGDTDVTAEQPFVRCPGIVVQATGGTMNRTPVIINVVVHHSQLLLSANLLAPEPGSTDVTIWWRVD